MKKKKNLIDNSFDSANNRFFGKWWLFISLFLDGETNRKRIITIAAD